ncbi:MAG: hypothetical protein UY01_C0002G0016 [Candidatus Nomurabacteria bacterium GW2011_GWB1_47_6]|uniref:O-antigen ligase-related domain-containing protein n=1 Tax=Candidatus Nomurabacteria bacterium GW2011_GWB1_47_6 TaxID=1618749 RepID=A0A0G1VCJ0_9BACT|nr:MAG: hypothetical protein UY01_C0002G0016 [Candidatus Nomurabacteria bacterium GW2011_GWB1_47_6]
MRTNIYKSIIGISLLVPLIFPVLYSSAFFNQSSFPKAIFFYFTSQLITFLYVWHGAAKGSIAIPKNYLFFGLFAYILMLFITGILGENFRQSFWSYYPHMTGIITWVHFFIFYIVISSIFKEVHWKYFFRALAVSTIVLLGFSYLGPDGFRLSSILSSGGSLLTNNTKSGMYYVLIFFMSFIGLSLEKNKGWRYVHAFTLAAIFFSPELFNSGIFAGDVSIAAALKNPVKLLGLARASTLVLWFGGVIAGALYFLHKIQIKENIKRALAAGGLLCLLALYGVVFGGLALRSGSVSGTDPQNALSSRLIVWDAAVKAIKQKPITGYGVENFDYIYQDYFDARVINLENGGAWFDRAHNFLLDEILGYGFAGFLIVAALFVIIVRMSLQTYKERREFHYLLVPYIFIFYFFQLQTAFQTITSLFLAFVLFAYLSSQHGSTFSVSISPKIKNYIKILPIPIFIVLLYCVVYLPLKQSFVLAALQESGSFARRIEIYKANEKSIKNLSISPDQTIQNYTNKYISTLAPEINIVYEKNKAEEAREETALYLDLYESYYPRYKDKYKFLIYYAHTINFAYLLGIDKLPKGEELLHEAFQISEAYPQAYQALAVNLYNQGRITEALSYAKQGYEADRTIEKSKELYDTLEARAELHGSERPLLYLSDL